MTGASAASRAIFAAAQGDAEVQTLQELHAPRSANHRRGDRRRRAEAGGEGRRPVRPAALRGDPQHRLRRLSDLLRPRSGRPRAGRRPVLHARRGLRLGWRTRAVPTWPGRSPSPTPSGRAGCRLDFLVQAVGPGTERLAAPRARRGPLDHRPARPAVRGAPELPPTPLERSWSAAASGSRRWRSGAAGCSAPGSRPGSCSASATEPNSGGLDLFDCSRDPAGERGRPHRAPRLRHRPARRAARGR